MLKKPFLRELAAFLFFAAFSVAITWPLAEQPATTVSDFGDPLLVVWILDWVDYALTHDPLHLYDAPMFHPGILPLAYSENFIVPAILVLPFHLAGLPPVVVYNIAFLLGFALSGYGAYVLARMVSGSTVGALVGGIFFAFCSFKFDHLSHLQIIFSAWVPLLLAALLAFWERPNGKRGALLALVLVANGLTNIYFLLLASVALLFAIVTLAILRPQGRRFYAGLAAAGIAAILILYPFLRPYRIVADHYHHVRTMEEVRSGSANWTNWLVPSWASRIYGPIIGNQFFNVEKQLFPGLMILFLTLGAIVATTRAPDAEPTPGEGDGPTPSLGPVSRSIHALDAIIVLALAVAWATTISDRYELRLFGHRLFSADGPDIPMMLALVATVLRFTIRLPRGLGGVPLRIVGARSRFSAGAWAAAVWIVVGVIGSLGVNAFLYTFFYRRFEPFQAMRVASRFAIVAYAGLAVWGALGVAAILRNRQGMRRAIAATILLVLMTVEVLPRIRWEHVPRETPAVYSWLAKTRIGPVVEIPFSGEGVDYRYLLGSTVHRVKLVNGTSGFFPSEFWKVRDPDSRDAFDEMLDILETYGTKLVIVHGDFLSGARHQKVAAWLRQNLASGRLAFLRRFDNEVFGDYVFAITRNLPDWKRYRAPEVPDGAGVLPGQNLERFLDYKSTHSDTITIWTEAPSPYQTVTGPLVVQGWALSPHGVRRVTVCLQNDRKCLEAQPVSRPDVKSSFPWMYLSDRPGFTLLIPERPASIPAHTSLIVEVEDHAGRIRRGRHVSFEWEKADDRK